MTRKAFVALTVAPILISSSSWAQTTLTSVDGQIAGDRFADAVAGIGDVNGDTIPDWAVGAPHANPNGPLSGHAVVISGSTGVELLQYDGNSAGDQFGSAVAGADLNGDGFSDLVVGAHGDDAGGAESGTIYVYSGLDGQPMYSRTGTSAGDYYGFAIDIVPDTDGDGLPEILVGAWTAGDSGVNSGQVQLLKGTDGSVIWTRTGGMAYDYFGKSVAGLEDVNGDGFGDVVIGAPGRQSGRGAAFVYSGANGALLSSLAGNSAGDSFGETVSSAGDLNGDLRGDFLIASPGSDAALSNAGMVQAYSGKRGTPLYTLLGQSIGDYFGSTLAGGMDVTGDSVPDFIIGAPHADPKGSGSGQVRVFSGSDGMLAGTLDGLAANDSFGGALACSADSNGDGVAELLIGAWGEDTGSGAFAGKLHVITFAEEPTNVVSYCSSTPNSNGTAASMGHLGSTVVSANDFQITAQGAFPNVPGLFFYGPDETATPFGDGTLCVGGPIARFDAVNTDATGAASHAVAYSAPPLPSALITAGSTWKFQFWYRDPAGTVAQFNLSNGLSVTFE
jgi:hypothetical protein